jgi:hypothetical protein
MRIGRSKVAILLSILVVTSLLVPLLVFINTAEVSSPSSGIMASLSTLETVVNGGPNAFNIDSSPPPPAFWYKIGDYPPIIMAENLDNGGKVVAGGIVYGCRGVYSENAGTYNQPYYFKPGETDNLFNAFFQWLKPGAENVLWYQGHNVYQRNKITQNSYDGVNPGISALADNLVVNFGYNINRCNGKTGYDNYQDINTEPITMALLSEFNILVLPQLQQPVGESTGNLKPEEIDNIVAWVQAGGGLVILDQSDYLGNCWAATGNAILRALGASFEFQNDQINVGTSFYYEAPVDTSTGIGAIYGKSSVLISSADSLRLVGHFVAVSIPVYTRSGMPGATLDYYPITISNGWDNTDNYLLTATDNSGWGLVVDPSSVLLGADNSDNTVHLRVTVPAGTSLGTTDNITVTATSKENENVTGSAYCIAQAAFAPIPFEDAYVSDDNADKSYGDLEYLYIGRFGNFWENAFLKFDLSAIPNDATIQEARIYLWCYATYASVYVQAHPVVDDSWDEFTITWNTAPSYDPNTALDNKLVSRPDVYYWDVTSFVADQYTGDKTASFALDVPQGTAPSRNASFEAKEYSIASMRPYLKVVYTVPSTENNRGVSVSISPGSKSGLSGATLTYTVTVTNTGSLDDNYSLTASDTSSWSPTLSSSTLSLAAGANGTATLTVTIPSSAANGDNDTVTVTATSQTDSTISGSGTCVGTVAENVVPGVEVSISPASASDKAGKTLNFTVTVTNTGSGTDTFDLTSSDTVSWGPTLSVTPPRVTLNAGDSRTIGLSITIPSTASANDVSTITVTATSETNSTVYADGTCTATCTGATTGGGTSVLVYVVIAVVVIVIIAVVLVVVLR